MSTEPVQRPKILIVEDEQIVAADLQRNLIQIGYEVVGVAARANEALRLTRDMCPDIILMDIQLQGKEDGITTAAEIRQNWSIPIVFLTANADERVLDRAKTVEPLGYIAKPFSRTELNAVVALALHQHRTARELFAENNWLATLLASLSEGVIATDADAAVRFMNPIAERLTGWTLAEGVGKQIEEIYPLLTPEGKTIEVSQLRRALTTNESVARERFLLVNRSGRRLFVEDGAAPIRNVDDSVRGAATIFLDVTDRLNAEQERERLLSEFARSNQELARFSYAVSHDLQAPVRTIRSLMELLARHRPGQNVEDQRLLRMVTEAAGGMQRLIESLLNYAQAGHGQIRPEAVALGTVIDTVEFTLGTLIAETNAKIVRRSLPILQADRTQLEQLIQNLVANAIQYRRTEEAPVIEISGVRVEGGWELCVADNGQGIPADARDQIFEPLKRLHGNEVPGSGLGLALCRTIVQRYGGHIWAESEGSGRGTTFHIFLADIPTAHTEA